jgi:hypothetical protein
LEQPKFYASKIIFVCKKLDALYLMYMLVIRQAALPPFFPKYTINFEIFKYVY